MTADPTLQDLKIENQKRDLEVQDLQENFNEISDILTEKSAVFNQQNIHFHQQQNKVSGIQKDLEYRDVQKETFEARIEKNTIEYEEVQQSIKRHTSARRS